MAATKLNLAELVEQMPATDKELQAKQPPAQNGKADETKANRKPDREGGSKFTGPDPAAAEEMCRQILAGGRDALRELIGMIRDPGDPEFKNYKAEYVLHCLAIFVGRPGQEAQRKLFAATLASQLSSGKISKPVQGLLIRELQVAGDREVAATLGKFLTDEELCSYAAAALVAIGDGAAEQLRKALPKANGKCRLILVQNLGVLRDAASLGALKQAANDADREVRLTAVWALARIGDPGSLDVLLKAADAPPSFERVKATQACLLLAENLMAAGKKNEAAKIYTYLSTTRTDPAEDYVRKIARQAMAGIRSI